MIIAITKDISIFLITGMIINFKWHVCYWIFIQFIRVLADVIHPKRPSVFEEKVHGLAASGVQ